jgi:hypothetical protein
LFFINSIRNEKAFDAELIHNDFHRVFSFSHLFYLPNFVAKYHHDFRVIFFSLSCNIFQSCPIFNQASTFFSPVSFSYTRCFCFQFHSCHQEGGDEVGRWSSYRELLFTVRCPGNRTCYLVFYIIDNHWIYCLWYEFSLIAVIWLPLVPWSLMLSRWHCIHFGNTFDIGCSYLLVHS